MEDRHILIATTGSLGDLYPFLAIGSELKQRGHQVTVATSQLHRQAVEDNGLKYFHMRPDAENSQQFHERFMHPKTGGEFAYRHFLGPAIRDSYADLRRAASKADLLVSQSLMALAAPLVATAHSIPWVSCVLQPMGFFSLHEQPNYLPYPGLPRLCGRYPKVHERVVPYVRKHTQRWVAPVIQLRRELGLPDLHPLYEGQHSPTRVLALFSPLFGIPQSDWPSHTVQTGTPLYHFGSKPLPTALKRFLDGSDQPLVVFTLSSAACNAPGQFYRESLRAAEHLGMRALLITSGLAASIPLPEPMPGWAFRVRYVPFESVFPYASVIVHSGGIASGFRALQAGKPQLVIPHAHDQLDNALRLQKLGVARVVPSRRVTWKSLANAIQSLALDAHAVARASELALVARAEDGVGLACDEIERQLPP